MIQFYNVKKKQKVEINPSEVTRHVYEKTAKNGKLTIRYALKAVDEDGTKFYDHLSGITARIVQHEIDHLDGITFDTKANRIHLQKAKKDRKLSGRYKKRNALDNVAEL